MEMPSIHTQTSATPAPAAVPEEDKSRRICPYCKQEYEIKTGIENWRNLFRRPTMEDFITLFIIVMVLFAVWAYNADTAACRSVITNFDSLCLQMRPNVSIVYQQTDYNFSARKLIIPQS